MSTGSGLPLAVAAGLDPASVTRDNYYYEQLLIDDGASAIWPLSDLPTQPKALDYIGHDDGVYYGGLLGSPTILFGERSYGVSQDFHYVIIPFSSFDTNEQTYEISVRPTVAGVVMARKGLFTLEVLNSTTIRLTVDGETPEDYTVTDAFDGKTWVLAVTFDLTADQYTLYVDGATDGVVAHSGSIPTPGTDIYIARHEDDASTSYRGFTSYLSFTPVELSAAEILLHFRTLFDYQYLVINETPYVYTALQDDSPFDDEMDNVETLSSSGLTEQTGGPVLHRTTTLFLDGNATAAFALNNLCTWFDDSAARSLEFWFRSPTPDTINPVIYSFSDHDVTDEYMYVQYRTTASVGPKQMRLFFRNNTGILGVNYYRAQLLIPDNALPNGVDGWNHVYIDNGATSGVVDGKYPLILLNGVKLTEPYDQTGTPDNKWMSNISGGTRSYCGRLLISGTDTFYDSHYSHAAFHAGRLTEDAVRQHYEASK